MKIVRKQPCIVASDIEDNTSTDNSQTLLWPNYPTYVYTLYDSLGKTIFINQPYHIMSDDSFIYFLRKQWKHAWAVYKHT